VQHRTIPGVRPGLLRLSHGWCAAHRRTRQSAPARTNGHSTHSLRSERPSSLRPEQPDSFAAAVRSAPLPIWVHVGAHLESHNMSARRRVVLLALSAAVPSLSLCLRAKRRPLCARRVEWVGKLAWNRLPLDVSTAGSWCSRGRIEPAGCADSRPPTKDHGRGACATTSRRRQAVQVSECLLGIR
jgi:hypothetical protein